MPKLILTLNTATLELGPRLPQAPLYIPRFDFTDKRNSVLIPLITSM